MLHAERPPAADASSDAEATQHVPKGTTPTWEMELLLSGATVFGLLQLPRAIDPSAFDLMLRLDDDLGPGITVLWMYARASILVLSMTFVTHLALRAYWAALVGMRSIYPGPLRWDRLRMGPLQRAAVEHEVSDFVARTEAADNRATRVFALGVAIAFVIMMPFLFVAVGVLLVAVSNALGGPDASRYGIFVFAGVALAPLIVLAFLDRRFGARVREGTRAHRWITAAFRGYHRVGFGSASNPLIALFQSSAGMMRTMAIMVGVMVASIFIVMLQFDAAMGGEGVGDFAGLPAEEFGVPQSSLPHHYASQRPTDEVQQAPYIPDRVVKGPYVELFVPYRPARHAPAMRAACPEAVAVVGQEGPPEAALACLARILDVRLDGAPVEVPLQSSTDPLSGMRGVVLMIPAQELAPGRHELTIARIARKTATKPALPYRIPFWR